jgi:hypothetical protein
MTNGNRIPLSNVPRAIRKIVGEAASVPSYRQIYSSIVNGAFPAEFENGRWYLKDLKPVVKYFGLTEKV